MHKIHTKAFEREDFSCDRLDEDGLQALMALMRGFVALGGFFMQPDVVDAALLREAQEHPENYQTLSVRVSGWNARFVTLNKEWQDMVIEQNEH
jgi:formate C-acetyltransferase